MNNSPSVILVVINYNEKEWLVNCLPSLKETDYPNFKIILIDNASKDGSAQFIKDNFNDIELIRNRRNVGLTRAVNLGINIAIDRGAKYVVIFNPDIKVVPDWLRELVRIVEKNTNIGISMPLHYDYSGEKIDFNLLNILNKNIQYQNDKNLGNLKESYELTSAIGGCMMININVIKKIGLMDPIYFLCAEDSDLARRVIFHGYKIVVAMKSKIMHWHRMLHKDNVDKRMGFFIFRSRFIYFLKDPNRPFLNNLWRYYFDKDAGALGMIKSWAPVNNLRYLALAGYVQLWIFFHLPIIFIHHLRDRKRR